MPVMGFPTWLQNDRNKLNDTGMAGPDVGQYSAAIVNASNDRRLWNKNGALGQQDTATASGSLPAARFCFGAVGTGASTAEGFDVQNTRYGALGAKLTSAVIAAEATAEQTFSDAIGRQIA